MLCSPSLGRGISGLRSSRVTAFSFGLVRALSSRSLEQQMTELPVYYHLEEDECGPARSQLFILMQGGAVMSEGVSGGL